MFEMIKFPWCICVVNLGSQMANESQVLHVHQRQKKRLASDEVEKSSKRERSNKEGIEKKKIIKKNLQKHKKTQKIQAEIPLFYI